MSKKNSISDAIEGTGIQTTESDRGSKLDVVLLFYFYYLYFTNCNENEI